ncbi:hypothetical protein H0H81_004701 [Sphagnurus paluster]|uniref:Uncharacterized protein n=1 Tax=Sphagnurus paluster TaxID=117069 RepID=A0A9P7K589_9AGAR|nr:hypothetical protein H0H81_004701 [Sphagnurus paluster]
MSVRHGGWISSCISEQFLMPVASYTLDGKRCRIVQVSYSYLSRIDHFDPSKLPVVDSSNTQRTKIIESTSDNAKQTLTAQIPTEDHLIQKNILKRKFHDHIADDTYLEINPRLQKRPRFVNSSQANTEQTFTNETTLHAINANSECFPRTHQSKHSPAFPRHSSQSPKDTIAFKPNGLSIKSLPVAKHSDHLSLYTGKKTNLDDMLFFKAAIQQDPGPAELPVVDFSRTQALTAHRSSLAEHSTLTHESFWTRARAQVASKDSGLLVLSVADILRTEGPRVDAKLFTRKGSYRGDVFNCVWR